MTQSRPEVLLKTAVAKVTSGIYTVDANILFVHNYLEMIHVFCFSKFRDLPCDDGFLGTSSLL